ncbi:hypothetical protein A6R68_21686 [Neotoma lepida]|uniref:thioredoxin-dependent peroxiredoxin n=1 Tax=Neotoma lepida TaxID=56216 RepID=A0A1A6HQW1_NEOLE|nr:hypothetical protein A6R68_21686 [Neotoma lepida]
MSKEMPKLSILPLTSKPKLCCQMINSKPSASVKDFFLCYLDFPSVCPMESIAFRDRAEEVKKLNGPVMGAAVESHVCHMARINTAKEHGRLGPLDNQALGLWSLKGPCLSGTYSSLVTKVPFTESLKVVFLLTAL